MHKVLVNPLEGLSLPRKSVVRLTDRTNMTLDVYLGCKSTIQPKKMKQEKNVRIKLELSENLTIPHFSASKAYGWYLDEKCREKEQEGHDGPVSLT